MPRYKYYCALCHQEFNDPKEHPKGSYFDNRRLNGVCSGDIRKQDHTAKKRQLSDNKPQVGDLPFTGEPHNIQ